MPKSGCSSICLFAILSLAGCQQGTGEGPAKKAQNDAAGMSSVRDMEEALGPADVKTFGGGDRLPIGGPIASIIVPQSPDEKRFIANFGCNEEVGCYGISKFDRYMRRTYPDIAQVRFKIPPEMGVEDKEDFESLKQAFRWGLYFAKLIPLANGQTLFELLTKCSKNVSWTNEATPFNDSKEKTVKFEMQYFPVLRQNATGEAFEMDILITRIGDKIEARSPAFSSSVLRDGDFMEKHGVSCWRNQS